MAFAWQRAAKDPSIYAQKIDDLPEDWRQWPAELQFLLLEGLRRKMGVVDVENFFKKSLHNAQKQILTEHRRFNVAACGRRFGKSVLGGYLDTEILLQGGKCAWMSPTFATLEDAWRDLKASLLSITTEKSEQSHRLEVNTGGVLECWSLDNPDAPRGRNYARIIVDEAAMVKQLGEVWSAVLEPMLMDTLGDAWFLSTPKGGNFFRTMFHWGQQPDRFPEWKSWQFPSTANTTPGVGDNIRQEVEKKRLTTPERWFRQEYLAEFIDDAGGVFRQVAQCATIEPDNPDFPIFAQNLTIDPSHTYVIGIDWGKLNDFTVLAVIDATTRQLVALDRFNMIDYDVQIGKLGVMARKFGTKTLIPERNSIGEPIIERLKADGYRVHPFTTTNASKAEIIDDLTLAFEQKSLEILNIPLLVDELQAYEAERLPSGLLRYSAPEGYHDDCFVAGTQILTDKGQKNIEEIQPGDMVLTRQGYKPVVMTRSTVKIVVDRIGLRGTPDHPVITPHGEKPLQFLGNNDKLHVWNPLSQQIEKLSFTEAKNIIATPSPVAVNCVSTFGDTINGEQHPSRFTVKSGLTLLARYLMVVWFTIKTIIRSTMHCPTLRLSLAGNMPVGIFGSGPLERSPVPPAKKPLRPNSTLRQSSVDTSVGQKHTEQKERVYNLQVAECPEYFANNILVHNCVMALALAWHGSKVSVVQEDEFSSYCYRTY